MKVANLQKAGKFIITAVLSLSIFILGYSIYIIDRDSSARETAAIQEVIDKALLQCYALEGSYPSDLQYLSDHYGVILNENDYFYYYEAYGANIFPDVQIVKK